MIDADEIANELLLSIDDWLTPFLALVSDNIYIQSLIILLIFLITAKLLSFITSKALLNLLRKNKMILGHKIVKILHVPVFYTILLGGIGAAIRWLNIIPWAHTISISIIASCIIVLWTIFLIRLNRIQVLLKIV